MKLKTVKSFLAAAIATAAALVSTVASAYDDGVLSTPDGTVERKDLGGDRYAYVFTNASAATTATLGRNAVLIEALVIGGGGAGAVPEGWIFSHEKNG